MASEIEPVEQVKPAVSDEDKAKAEATSTPVVPAKSGARFVRYTGAREEHASIRRIAPDAWANVGVSTTRTDVWELGNDWKLPVGQFTQPQLDYLLNVDGRFELADTDGKIVVR